MVKLKGILLLGLLLFLTVSKPAHALSSLATPWTEEQGFQNLYIGASSSNDVERIMGKAPDDVVKQEQIYPVITNYYYYDASKSGAASVFVFENNLLVGLLYKSPDNQYVDLSFFIPSNDDRMLNSPILAGLRGYYPGFPLYTW